MNLDRVRVATLASLLSLLCIAVPLVVSVRLSRSNSVDAEQLQLRDVALRALQRSESTLSGVRTALQGLEALPDAACSNTHIARMRALVTESSPIHEIGYFANGKLVCTSWGAFERPLDPSPVDFVTADGMGVSLGVRPAINPQVSMTAFRSERYDVLVPPTSLVDIMVTRPVAVVLAAHGRTVATLHRPDPALAGSVEALPAAGLTGRTIYAVARRGEWTAVAMAPRDGLAAGVRYWSTMLLPAGLIVAGLLVGAVVLYTRRRLSPLGELKQAVRRREFVVHYQPVVDLQSGECVGAEALVRWQRPDGALVPPDSFIPLAEESGLILPITDQVVERVAHDLAAALAADRSLHIAINLCAADMQTGRALDVIARALSHTGIEPKQIWIEATERGFMDHHAALQTIRRARARGHQVAIDDFGTGYSSLKYLKDLPVDALKIDKSFVDPLAADGHAGAILVHVIGMARTLGLHTVAEGVETEPQARWLRARGVEYAQGWLFSRALPPTAFLDYVRENRRQTATAAGA